MNHVSEAHSDTSSRVASHGAYSYTQHTAHDDARSLRRSIARAYAGLLSRIAIHRALPLHKLGCADAVAWYA